MVKIRKSRKRLLKEVIHKHHITPVVIHKGFSPSVLLKRNSGREAFM